MKVEDAVILLLVPVLFVTLLATPAIADYAQTTVFFNVPSASSFTVTVPGQSAVASNGTNNPNSPPTANIEFNSSVSTRVNIPPCTVGGTGNCQNGSGSTGTPIFQYDNTGNVNLTILLIFNSTLPSGVTVHGNSSWANTSLSNGTAYANDRALNATDSAVMGINLDSVDTSILNVYLFSNFTSVTAGTRASRLLNHTSVQTA